MSSLSEFLFLTFLFVKLKMLFIITWLNEFEGGAIPPEMWDGQKRERL